METKQFTIEATEAIAQTEKKMNMSLDEIIEMSKKNSSKGRRTMRRPLNNRGNQNLNLAQRNAKVQQYMDFRSSIRQSELAKRRSSFSGSRFPVATEVAKKVAAMPFTNRVAKKVDAMPFTYRVANVNRTRFAAKLPQRKLSDGSFTGKDQVVTKQRPLTLDARFANIREQKIRLMFQQGMGTNGRQFTQRPNVQRQQYLSRAEASSGAGRRLGNYRK